MKMLNSGMYLRATTDGERVVQSWADDWEWNQMWRLLGKDTVVGDTGTTANPAFGQIAGTYGTSVHYANKNLFIEIGSAFAKGATVRILDLQGREVMRKFAAHGVSFDVRPLPAGIYHVVVSDGVHTDMRRFRK
jgi:hypothetical protein